MEISLYRMQHLFDPLTRAHANHKLRILINDGFATHESLKLMTFYFENNIILYQWPSHTSHKLQPCDVGVFGTLKKAYRDQVELLYCGGINTVGKHNFILLYSRAHDVTFTARNIKSARSRAGLYPHNPDRVLHEIQKPQTEQNLDHIERAPSSLRSPEDLLPAPVTAEGFRSLRRKFGPESQHLNPAGKHRLQKLAIAAEKAIADRGLLVEKNRILFDQNNDETTRSSIKSTEVGTAKIISYGDVLAARRKREAKKTSIAERSGRSHKRPGAGTLPNEVKRTQRTETERGS